MDYVERTDTVEVPKNTGLPGLFKMLGALLGEIPRVKEIVIKSSGQVRYTWYSPMGAPEKALQVQFEDLMPYAVIRNTPLEEVTPRFPYMRLSSLFLACDKDHLYPICFVTGVETRLWKWMISAFGLEYDQTEAIYGYPLLLDKSCPDDALILCASFARTNQLADTYKCYKVLLEVAADAK
jgi:hypothetical protein